MSAVACARAPRGCDSLPRVPDRDFPLPSSILIYFDVTSSQLTVAPVLELLAEHTHPVAEGVSAAAYSVAVAVVSILYTMLLPLVSAGTMHSVLCATLLTSALSLLCARGAYHRSDASVSRGALL